MHRHAFALTSPILRSVWNFEIWCLANVFTNNSVPVYHIKFISIEKNFLVQANKLQVGTSSLFSGHLVSFKKIIHFKKFCKYYSKKIRKAYFSHKIKYLHSFDFIFEKVKYCAMWKSFVQSLVHSYSKFWKSLEIVISKVENWGVFLLWRYMEKEQYRLAEIKRI